MAKYHNVPTIIDGIRFASKAEARRYGELKLLRRAGEIEDYSLQPRFKLEPGITYVGDFLVTEKGVTRVEDTKGVETQVFKMKAKMFRSRHPDIELRIIK
jgi:hypothetical protein